jgi:hypothetical protein
LVLSQGCESLFKIGDERVRVSSLDDHVLHIVFDILIELLLEVGLDSSLVCSAGVLQSERHCLVAVGAEQGDERDFLLVFFLDTDLVVARVAVEEAEQVADRRGVDDLINSRQHEGVLGQCLLRAVLVEDGVGEPLRMENFRDETDSE